MKQGIVSVRVGLSYDPLRFGPCFHDLLVGRSRTTNQHPTHPTQPTHYEVVAVRLPTTSTKQPNTKASRAIDRKHLLRLDQATRPF
eukprot:7226573-Lingulodinium_polyedra.AAC.1